MINTPVKSKADKGIVTSIKNTIKKMKYRATIIANPHKNMSATALAATIAAQAKSVKHVEQLCKSLKTRGYEVVITDFEITSWKLEHTLTHPKTHNGTPLATLYYSIVTTRNKLVGGVVYTGSRAEMLAITPNVCVQCGAHGAGFMVTCDHIYSRKQHRHLESQIVNHQPLCDKCNVAKGCMTNTDYRPPSMKLDLIQRLLTRRGDTLVESISDMEIEIITQRILLRTYAQIANDLHCSVSKVGKVIRNHIFAVNEDVKELSKLDKAYIVLANASCV